MTLEPFPDAALAGVVRPMILQFFVLAVLWIHLVAPGSGEGVAPRGGPGARDWTRTLLPFLMVSTGLLFFSVPLQPVWGALLGPGGEHLPALPASVARFLVLAMNLGVLAWGLIVTGGVRRSPLLPLFVSLPPALWLVEGGPRPFWMLGVGVLAVVAVAVGGRMADAAGGQPHPVAWGAGLGGTLTMLGLAAWLGAG